MRRGWRDALVILQPATVTSWYRSGFRHDWHGKSRSKPGRLPIAVATIMLLRRMPIENVAWNAPRIKDEHALPGRDVTASTVAKFMVRRPVAEPDRSRKAFLRKHREDTAACDLFIVPTVTFQRLFCIVVRSLDRRTIVHVNVTRSPTAA